jgi:hypothetical protein
MYCIRYAFILWHLFACNIYASIHLMTKTCRPMTTKYGRPCTFPRLFECNAQCNAKTKLSNMRQCTLTGRDCHSARETCISSSQSASIAPSLTHKALTRLNPRRVFRHSLLVHFNPSHLVFHCVYPLEIFASRPTCSAHAPSIQTLS